MPPESLLQQYLASTYRIREGGREIVLHVGVRSAELAELLRSLHAASGAFITAWNPGSRPLAAEENLARNEALRREAMAAGHRLLEGQGHSPGRDWCEESYLVVGIDRPRALALARRHGQLAFLFVNAEAVPELVICEAEPA